METTGSKQQLIERIRQERVAWEALLNCLVHPMVHRCWTDAELARCLPQQGATPYGGNHIVAALLYFFSHLSLLTIVFDYDTDQELLAYR